MAGLLSNRVAAGMAFGAAKGVGDYIAESGREKRELMLRQLQYDNQEKLTGLQHENRLSEIKLTNDLAAEREDAKMKALAEREDAKIAAQDERQNSAMSHLDTDSDGNAVGVTRGGSVKPLGYKRLTKEPAQSRDRMIQVVGDDGNVTWMPESEAAGQQALGSKDVREAAQTRRVDNRQEAQRRAAREAEDRAGWFSRDTTDFAQDGGSREAFTNRRASEIEADLNAAGNGKRSGGTTRGMMPQSQNPAFKSAEDVRAAWRAGKIGRDEAVAILRRDFGLE